MAMVIESSLLGSPVRFTDLGKPNQQLSGQLAGIIEGGEVRLLIVDGRGGFHLVGLGMADLDVAAIDAQRASNQARAVLKAMGGKPKAVFYRQQVEEAVDRKDTAALRRLVADMTSDLQIAAQSGPKP